MAGQTSRLRYPAWPSAIASEPGHRVSRLCQGVLTFLAWCVLLVFCWPLALVALLLYPIVWVLLLPFRVVGIAVDGVLALIRGIVMLPARLLRGPRAF